MEFGLGSSFFDKCATEWFYGLESDGILAPNAGAELLRRYRIDRGDESMGPFVESVVRFLTGTEPARFAFLNPANPLPPTDEHPFATASRYLKPLLSDPGRNEMTARFAVECGGLTDREGGPPSPGRMAGAVAGKLFSERANHGLIAAPIRPGPTPREERVRSILDSFKAGGYLPATLDTAKLAGDRDWATLGNSPADEVARTVAKRLQSPGYRDLLAPGVKPPSISMSEPFYNARMAGRDAESPARQELEASPLYGF